MEPRLWRPRLPGIHAEHIGRQPLRVIVDSALRMPADAAIRIMPAGRPARVRGIQSHGSATPAARPGARVALSLAAVERDDVPRGSWIISDPDWPVSKILRADVALLEDATPLGARTRVRFHLGTQDVGARVVAAGGALTPGEIRGARVLLDQPVLARAGDRFVLRLPSPAATIGGGVVTDPAPAVARPRPWPAKLAVNDRLEAALREGAGQGVSRRSLAMRLGISPSAAAALATEHPRVVATPDGRLVATSVVEQGAARAAALIADHHRLSPLDPGMPLAALRSALGVTGTVAELALARLVAAGTAEIVGATARQAGWTPTLGGAAREVATAVEARLRSGGREPPSVAELMADVGVDPRPVLRFLERQGSVVAVEEDRYYLTSELAALVDTVRTRMVAGRVYSPAELRDLTGLSRKYLIPFLEYCDRHGVTARQDSGRVRAGT